MRFFTTVPKNPPKSFPLLSKTKVLWHFKFLYSERILYSFLFVRNPYPSPYFLFSLPWDHPVTYTIFDVSPPLTTFFAEDLFRFDPLLQSRSLSFFSVQRKVHWGVLLDLEIRLSSKNRKTSLVFSLYIDPLVFFSQSSPNYITIYGPL